MKLFKKKTKADTSGVDLGAFTNAGKDDQKIQKKLDNMTDRMLSGAGQYVRNCLVEVPHNTVDQRFERFRAACRLMENGVDLDTQAQVMIEEIAFAHGTVNGLKDGLTLTKSVMKAGAIHGMAMSNAMPSALMDMLQKAGVSVTEVKPDAIEFMNSTLEGMSHDKIGVICGMAFEDTRRNAYFAAIERSASSLTATFADDDVAKSIASQRPGTDPSVVKNKVPHVQNTLDMSIDRLKNMTSYRFHTNAAASWVLELIEYVDNLSPEVLGQTDTKNGVEAFSHLIGHMVMSRCAEAMGQDRNNTNFTPEHAKKALEKFETIRRLVEAQIKAYIPDDPKAEEKRRLN